MCCMLYPLPRFSVRFGIEKPVSNHCYHFGCGLSFCACSITYCLMAAYASKQRVHGVKSLPIMAKGTLADPIVIEDCAVSSQDIIRRKRVQVRR